MDFKVILRPLALEDLKAVVEHIAEEDAQAANRLGNALLDQAESLARLPERGSKVRRRRGVRKLVHPPYVIFYRIDEARHRVEVLRFWHGAQNSLGLRLK